MSEVFSDEGGTARRINSIGRRLSVYVRRGFRLPRLHKKPDNKARIEA